MESRSIALPQRHADVNGVARTGSERRQPTSESERRFRLVQDWFNTRSWDSEDVILLSGSAGAGIADHSSDIDLYLLSRDPGTLRSCGIDLERHGLRRVFTLPTSRGGMLERFLYDGISVDMETVPIAEIERTINEVLREYDIDPLKQKVVRGLIDALAIYGEPQWSEWYHRLAKYPDQLAHKMVRAHLHFERVSDLRQRTLARGDVLAFYSRLSAVLLNVVGTLAGLNRYYLGVAPGVLRWTDFDMSRMRLVSSDTATRMDACLREPSDANLKDIDTLVQQVLAMVDRAVPDVTTEYIRPFLDPPGR